MEVAHYSSRELSSKIADNNKEATLWSELLQSPFVMTFTSRIARESSATLIEPCAMEELNSAR